MWHWHQSCTLTAFRMSSRVKSGKVYYL